MVEDQRKKAISSRYPESKAMLLFLVLGYGFCLSGCGTPPAYKPATNSKISAPPANKTATSSKKILEGTISFVGLRDCNIVADVILENFTAEPVNVSWGRSLASFEVNVVQKDKKVESLDFRGLYAGVMLGLDLFNLDSDSESEEESDYVVQSYQKRNYTLRLREVDKQYCQGWVEYFNVNTDLHYWTVQTNSSLVLGLEKSYHYCDPDAPSHSVTQGCK